MCILYSKFSSIPTPWFPQFTSSSCSYVSSTDVIDDIFDTITSSAGTESVTSGVIAELNSDFAVGLTGYDSVPVSAMQYRLDLVRSDCSSVGSHDLLAFCLLHLLIPHFFRGAVARSASR